MSGEYLYKGQEKVKYTLFTYEISENDSPLIIPPVILHFYHCLMSFAYSFPSFVVAKVTEAQWEEIIESERGSKQISQDVLLSRFVSPTGQEGGRGYRIGGLRGGGSQWRDLLHPSQ